MHTYFSILFTEKFKINLKDYKIVLMQLAFIKGDSFF